MTSTNFASLTSATATTPFMTDDQKIITEDPELTSAGSPDEELPTEPDVDEFATTGATTSVNKITTEEPAVTTEAGRFPFN